MLALAVELVGPRRFGQRCRGRVSLLFDCLPGCLALAPKRLVREAELLLHRRELYLGGSKLFTSPADLVGLVISFVLELREPLPRARQRLLELRAASALR